MMRFSLRRTKWRRNCYSGKWQYKFQELQAMDMVKKVLCEKQRNPSQIQLVSAVNDSFKSYNCNLSPTAYSYIINFLLKNLLFDELPPLLHQMETVEKFDPPERIFVDLIRAYGRTNMLKEAVETFYQIPRFRCNPTALSLDVLLSTLCEKQEGLALVCPVLEQTLTMNIRLEVSSFSILIKTLCKMGKFNYAMEILDLIDEYGYTPDSSMYQTIHLSICKHASSREVQMFHEKMSKAGVLLGGTGYSNVIRVFAREKKVMKALDMLYEMELKGFQPDVIDYSIVLDGMIGCGKFDKADELIDGMLVIGINPDVFTYNIYINGLCKQGKFEAASEMLVNMEEVGCKPNAVTYNTLIAGLSKVGELDKAKRFLRKMNLKCISGNMHTYEILINGFLQKDEVIEAFMLFSEMMERGIIPKTSTSDSMMCALCRSDRFPDAYLLLETIVSRCIIPGKCIWETLIHGAINCSFGTDVEDCIGY